MKQNMKIFLLFLSAIVCLQLTAQEGYEELFIETMNPDEAYDIAGGECRPGDIIITVKSNLTDLTFDSNVADIEQPVFDAEKQEYVFCHYNESFILTMSAPGYIAKEVYIDGTSPKYGFKVISKIPVGKILINTTPENALVDFGLSGISPQLTNGEPFEMNTGNYTIRISKSGYSTIEKEIIIPSSTTMAREDIILTPEFAKIKLDITTADKSRFLILPVIDIDTSHVNLADLSDVTKIGSFDSADELRYFQLYSGGIIPVPQGNHSYRINAPGYKTHSGIVSTANGSTSILSAKMESISGYITIIDVKDALGAEVFVDDELLGSIPLFKQAIKVGAHKVTIKKEGFVPDKEEYRVLIKEDMNEDLQVVMNLYKEQHFISEPTGSEIFVNNQRKGFTPATINLQEGKNEIVLRKSGYSDYHVTKYVTKVNTATETLNIKLKKNYPIMVKSEMKGARIKVLDDNEQIVAEGRTPELLDIPFGRYKVQLFNEKRKGFSRKIEFDGQKESIKLPFYSYGTFTSLVGDYYLKRGTLYAETGNNGIYNLFAKGQFGRFVIFPGLSTSILNVSVFEQNNEKAYITGYSLNLPKYVFAGTCLFLNGEFRMGGSIVRNLDIGLLGTFAWHPDVSGFINIDLISGYEYFIGVEASTRISVFNINLKAGKQIYSGQTNLKYDGDHINTPVEMNDFIISAGFTLGQKVYKGNNMLRLWK